MSSTPVPIIKNISLGAFIKLSLPNILAGIMTPVGGLISSIFLGHLTSPVPLAGVGLATIVIEAFYYALYFLRLSTITFAGEAHGLSDKHALIQALYRGLAMALGMGILLTITGPTLISHAFSIFSAEEAVEAAAALYFNAKILGAIPFLCLMVIFGWFVGQGKPQSTFVLVALMGVLDVFFSWLFIIQNPWNEVGAGYAGMAAEWITFIVALIWVHQAIRTDHLPLRQSMKDIFHWSDFKRYFELSRDIFVRTLFLLTMFSTFINASALFGVAFMAATSILIRLLDLVAFFIEGFAATVQSMTAVFWAKRQYSQTGHILRLGWACALLSLVTISALGGIFSYVWIPLLTNIPEVSASILTYAPYLVIVLCFSGVSYIFDGFFAAIHRAAYLRNAMICATIVYAPILWYVYQTENPTLLWWSIIGYMFGRAAYLFHALGHLKELASLRLLRFYKRMPS